MEAKTYTFSRVRNNYFAGHDLHVVDRETGAVISVNLKEDLLAVNVKDQDTIHDEPWNVRVAAEEIEDDALRLLYRSQVEDYWLWANESLAGKYGFSGIRAAGRSGGWLAVEGTDTIEEDEISETPAPGSPWARFLALAFEAVAAIKTYRERFRAEVLDYSADAGQVPASVMVAAGADKPTAYRETFSEISELLNVIEAVGRVDAEILPTYGVETDPADDPDKARPEAEDAMLAMVATMRSKVAIELYLSGGQRSNAGDERKLVFECSTRHVDGENGDVLADRQLTVERVYFVAVGTHIHELQGDDRDMAMMLGQRASVEIQDAVTDF